LGGSALSTPGKVQRLRLSDQAWFLLEPRRA
jgi:hypothetical protein